MTARSIASHLLLSGLLAIPLATSALGEDRPSVAALAARPGGRAQSASILAGGGPLPIPCLTPVIQSYAASPHAAPLPARRAIVFLQNDAPLPGERRAIDRDGTVVRYTLDRSSFDRIDATDENFDGRPDIVEAVLAGVADARRLLVEQMDLPTPGPFEIVLARLGGQIEGFSVPPSGTSGRRARTIVLLEAQPKDGAEGARMAAIHQFSHAVAMAPGGTLPPAWGEALAAWTRLRIDGASDPRSMEIVATRIARLDEGLLAEDLALAAGNAAWLEFLDDFYGPSTLRAVLQELGSAGPVPASLDRALGRAAGSRLGDAFREFQLWCLLVGPLSDGRHFVFAPLLPGPRVASEASDLPAISIQEDPAVAPLGCAAIRFRPESIDGGMTVRFEGEFPSSWGADLVVFREDQPPHRVPLAVATDGGGGITVPLDGLEQAVLLVRNLDWDDALPRRYTWSVHREAGYPVEIASASVSRLAEAGPGVRIAWDTSSETAVVGYTIHRVREDGGEEVTVTPIWVPAIGDENTPADYEFVDTSAEAGVSYLYRIETITPTGLGSRTRPLAVAPRLSSD